MTFTSVIEQRRQEIITRMEAEGTLSPTCERCAVLYKHEDPQDGVPRYGDHKHHEAEQRLAAQNDPRGDSDR